MTCTKCNTGREARVKGLCSACYMRERRAQQKGGYHRRPNGQGVVFLMSCIDQSWRDKIHDRIDATGGPDACHEWQGSLNKGGYGVIVIAGFTITAHRAIHVMCGGEPDTQVVMHTCDNPKCCNPRHLRAGTYQENMDDMRAKERGGSGFGAHLKDRKRHPAAKAVVTPSGTYPSAALAAEALGLEYHVVKYRARKGIEGFAWA